MQLDSLFDQEHGRDIFVPVALVSLRLSFSKKDAAGQRAPNVPTVRANRFPGRTN